MEDRMMIRDGKNEKNGEAHVNVKNNLYKKEE